MYDWNRRWIHFTAAGRLSIEKLSLKFALHCITLHCMDAQLTVRIPLHLREALDRASHAAGLRNSDVVRRALQNYLAVADERDAKPAERVRELIGSLESGVPDLAERNRTYIIESLTSGK